MHRFKWSGMRSPHLTSSWPYWLTPFAQKMSEVLKGEIKKRNPRRGHQNHRGKGIFEFFGPTRFHQHPVLPRAARTQFQIGGIALRGMEAGVTQTLGVS